MDIDYPTSTFFPITSIKTKNQTSTFITASINIVILCSILRTNNQFAEHDDITTTSTLHSLPICHSTPSHYLVFSSSSNH